MTGLGSLFSSLGFVQPWFLLGLLTLPVLWYLLRFVPPQPAKIWFPPLRLLQGLQSDENSPHRSPWWLLLLRILLIACVILAFARPVWNSDVGSYAGFSRVLIVVDNGWASASGWEKRKAVLDSVLVEAEQNGGQVILAGSSFDDKSLDPAKAFQFQNSSVVRETISALEPMPINPDRKKLLALLQKHVATGDGLRIVWLSDGLDYRSADAFADGLIKLAGGAGRLEIYRDLKDDVYGLYGVSDASGLSAVVRRAGTGSSQGTVFALNAKGEQLGEVPFVFSGSEQEKKVRIELPFEIRNQVSRLVVAREKSAGAVYLLDSRSLRYRVGIVSGEASEKSQPLLSSIYYVEKAISPYSDVIVSKERNISVALEELLRSSPSAIILVDVGALHGGDEEALQAWVKKGGVLIRFAGPRLGKKHDSLLPVRLRHGGRTLGGALSWGKPQKLAPFEKGSPFYGLNLQKDVSIRRQVLADPTLLAARGEVWSRLEDGTPLVTARKDKLGWMVLFHVTASSEWSDLPLSGLFVQMLRRLTKISGSQEGGADNQNNSKSVSGKNLAPPLRVLNGFGVLKPPAVSHRSVDLAQVDKLSPGYATPPGYYGTGQFLTALNVLKADTKLKAISSYPAGALKRSYTAADTVALLPWLIMMAIVLFLVDTFVWLMMNRQSVAGALSSAAVFVVIVLAGLAGQVTPGLAESDEERRTRFALKASNGTHLAYVITGDQEIDRVSRLGLSGLSKIVAARTAVEPAEPMGVNLERDELAFFPILYWPIHVGAKDLSDKALAKVDAYMRRGGMVLFDTRDFQAASATFDQNNSPAMRTLRRLVGRLNIPPLAPVREGHVMTKSFYLLKSFPGRWDGGQLWVEASTHPRKDGQKRARQADGVTSVMVTSNDFAGAWAMDNQFRPIFPVVPGGDLQREMARRVGVNIVMYALTGNYKADQVHIDAVLERLGQ